MNQDKDSQPVPEHTKDQDNQTDIFFYWLATCRVSYRDGKKDGVEYVNVMLNSVMPGLTRNVLMDIQKTAVRMMMQERKVTSLSVRNITIMNLSPIGHMTKEQFHGSHETLDAPGVPEEQGA